MTLLWMIRRCFTLAAALSIILQQEKHQVMSQQPCSVCGEGLAVGAPYNIFDYPNEPAYPCYLLEEFGQLGYIPLEQCAFLPPLIDGVCECEFIFTAPTLSPVTVAPAVFNPDINQEPTTVEAPASAPPATPERSCSVCGDGFVVGAPDKMFVFGGQPSVACGILELAGEVGEISVVGCEFLPPVVFDECECQARPTPSPSGSSLPSSAPSLSIAPTVSQNPSQSSPPSTSPSSLLTSTSPAISSLSASPTTAPDGNTSTNYCSICGDGNGHVVGGPDIVIFSLPGNPPVYCGQVEQLGFSGGISPKYCEILQGGLIYDHCQCGPAAPSAPP